MLPSYCDWAQHRLPDFTTPAQYSSEVLAVAIREGNKKDSNRKERNQSIPICRWHNPLHKRSLRLY